ncbi:TspO/MBR family protein [Ruminococcus difficilis]|uniref:Tryptophan-rich sensory protein n=1 Tax=Ruminococcus difficilis TaxID=2763069 RepID=A0A935C5C0_9FIRM|nr:TspO/MBR family protein [Ruminococcus difficilis]MBK6090032.1 tryptophan-rich sensory protein [Ruminococcus difficilis]
MTIVTTWDKVKTYLLSILVPLVSGALVGLLTSGSMDYTSLEKPPLAPPSILFPIAWSVLYLLMGISHGILKVNDLSDSYTEIPYYAQLIVNLLWPVLFFVFKWRLPAFIWIVTLDILVITMAVRFYKRHRTAGLLQLPYIAWVLFASYLNLGIYLLNG